MASTEDELLKIARTVAPKQVAELLRTWKQVRQNSSENMNDHAVRALVERMYMQMRALIHELPESLRHDIETIPVLYTAIKDEAETSMPLHDGEQGLELVVRNVLERLAAQRRVGQGPRVN